MMIKALRLRHIGVGAKPYFYVNRLISRMTAFFSVHNGRKKE